MKTIGLCYFFIESNKTVKLHLHVFPFDGNRENIYIPFYSADPQMKNVCENYGKTMSNISEFAETCQSELAGVIYSLWLNDNAQ
jgi:hypothetical protein